MSLTAGLVAWSSADGSTSLLASALTSVNTGKSDWFRLPSWPFGSQSDPISIGSSTSCGSGDSWTLASEISGTWEIGELKVSPADVVLGCSCFAYRMVSTDKSVWLE